jgi:hypothetical protein
MTTHHIDIAVSIANIFCFTLLGLIGMPRPKLVILGILIPIIVSIVIYYVPALVQDRDMSEYNSWAVYFIPRWAFVGFFAALIGSGIGAFTKKTCK